MRPRRRPAYRTILEPKLTHSMSSARAPRTLAISPRPNAAYMPFTTSVFVILFTSKINYGDNSQSDLGRRHPPHAPEIETEHSAGSVALGAESPGDIQLIHLRP